MQRTDSDFLLDHKHVGREKQHDPESQEYYCPNCMPVRGYLVAERASHCEKREPEDQHVIQHVENAVDEYVAVVLVPRKLLQREHLREHSRYGSRAHKLD